MKRLLLLLTLLLGFVWYHTELGDVPEGDSTVAVVSEQGFFDVPQLPSSKEGRIAEPIVPIQLGNIRTMQVMPVHGHGPHRSSGRAAFACHPVSLTLKHIFDGRRLETAPFQSAASRHYYIIALRRLIL